MKKYTARLPPEVESFIRRLHPQVKTKIRNALEEIETNPDAGKPLRERLEGLWSYRVSRYRIVYEIQRSEILVNVVDIDERKIIYEKVAALLKK